MCKKQPAAAKITGYNSFGGYVTSGRLRFDMGDIFALAYLIFFLLEPIARRSPRYWAECLSLLAVFLVLWFSFIYSRDPKWKQRIAAAVLVLGMGTMPINIGGGICFLIYAVSLVPYCVSALPGQVLWMGSNMLLLYGEERWFHLPASTLFFTMFFALFGGGANIFFAEKERNNSQLQRKQDEIEALAAVAERERIARDLHDVLGHTLSVIVLKSELAHRLLERELSSSSSNPIPSSRPEHSPSEALHLPPRPKRSPGSPADLPAGVESGVERLAVAPAQLPDSPDPATLHRICSEIADVERTARTALAEVREAIVGYRARGLGAELTGAREMLAAADVALTVEGHFAQANLSAAEETVFSLALREAVTNIVRHAGATACTVRFGLQHGTHRLEIKDNGHHTGTTEGNGLRGMRERAESLGGHLRVDRQAGTCLQLDLPMTSKLESSPAQNFAANPYPERNTELSPNQPASGKHVLWGAHLLRRISARSEA